MADALAPWLLDYVLSVSETYGANLSNAPPHTKGKKVQIAEFLTYGSDADDSLLWARISDKQYIIPIKFTKTAVAQYYERQNTTKRFTQHKTAVINIKNFRLIFTRIPGTLGTMSSQPSLAIECPWFSVLGSSGEAIFGNPKPITDHPDLDLWSECLKHDGGAGNILKDIKMRLQLNDLAGVTHFPVTLPEGPRSPVFKRNQPTPSAPVNASIVSYMNKWQFIEKTQGYRRLPEAINPSYKTVCARAIASDLKILPSTQQCRDKPPEVPLMEPSSSNNAFSSSIPAPTPAQRMKANMLEQECYLDHGPHSEDLMLVSRKISRPASPKLHDYMDAIRVLAPNSDTSSQSQVISCNVQAGLTINVEESQALLSGITVDLRGEHPFYNLLRVREILERTDKLR